MTKPNCYECVHRRSVPGDAHSSCAHPDNGDVGGGDMFSALIALMGGAKAGNKVTANPHGVRNGWFMYPINFDPAWLETCAGFTEKAK